MTSFVYQPHHQHQQEQMNVISSMNRERQDVNMQTDKKSARKSLVLHQSSAKLKRKVIETNRDKGLTYSSKMLDFDGYDDEEQRERKDRSLKIDCSGPADIVADIQNLNYEYVPKKKEKRVNQKQNKLQSNVGQVNIEQKIANNQQQIQGIRHQSQPVDKGIHEIVREVQQKQKLQQSWDLQQKRKQKYNLIWFIILISLLFFFLNHNSRYIGFDAYLSMRKSIL